jgi:hypothetical protein
MSGAIQLFASKRVLETPNSILNLAGDLIRLAFGLQLCIASDLASLHGAFGLPGRALDPILSI